MKRDNIIANVQKLLNNQNDGWSLEKEIGLSSVESYLENVVIRLANIYSKYCNNEAGDADFYSVLREFMLAFRTDLALNDLDVDKAKRFSIFYNDSTRKYYTTYGIPSYIKHKEFVENSCIDIYTQLKPHESSYMLKLNSYMKSLTGFEQYKSLEQKLCVHGAINTPESYTSLICMPTGGGKSLITQALAYEKEGLSIVVVPTISLAIDQERVAKKNIKIAKENEIFSYYSGAGNVNDIKTAIRNQTARLLFISPEALIKNEAFQEIIDQANAIKYIKNLIIDEAHIVVSWGDFFRVDYQCLGPWRKGLLKANPNMRTFLMSATFTDDTVKILKRIFSETDKWIEIRCDSLRKEPRFILINSDNFSIKKKRVLELVDLMPKPMILYVNSPYDAKTWKGYLEEQGYKNIETYTGETRSSERQRIIKDWADNKYEIMLATSAFGVGVDKSDVRTVLHLYVPENPDTYYQELGRGGRDGMSFLSIMCIEKDDIDKAFNHVNKVLTTEKLSGRWWSMLENPNNMWIRNEIAMFASTKPKYRRTYSFEEGNDTDEKWNINVILLLARYNLIKITAIELDDDNRYIFTIEIQNEIITEKSDRALAKFEEIRNQEAKKSSRAFNLMKSSILKSGNVCWSSMFYDTYPLVSEYCAGCEEHEYMECDEASLFPLKVNISIAPREFSEELKQSFSSTDEALMVSDLSPKELIEKYAPNVVVTTNADGFEESVNPYIMYLNFREYAELRQRDSGLFISGLVMILYSDDQLQSKTEYQIIKRYMGYGNKILHVTKQDFLISNISNKTISSDVDGRILN